MALLIMKRMFKMAVKFYNIFFLLLFSFACVSCGAINYHVDSVNKWGELIAQTRSEYEAKYIGASKKRLIEDFGEPRSINTDAWINGEKHEEFWYYNFSRGYFKEANSEPAKAVWFYISNDIVQAIKVF